MSTAQQEPEVAEDPKRKSLTLQERWDVTEYLVKRDGPVIADTKAEAARMISAATGVEITAAQIDYLIEQLPRLELGRYVVIGGASNQALADQLASLKANIKQHGEDLDKHSALLDHLDKTLQVLADKFSLTIPCGE